MRLVCYALERVRAGVRSADRRARARAVGPAGLLGEAKMALAGWLAALAKVPGKRKDGLLGWAPGLSQEELARARKTSSASFCFS